MNTWKDRALGCLIGGMIGDAIGAVLELETRPPIERSLINNALALTGGGSMNTAPGQFTDDCELMLSLCHGLIGTHPSNKFPYEKVAQQYINWYKSEPFDMGRTCRSAFGFCESAKEMLHNALKYNTFSQANGALMRCAPIAVWCSYYDIDINQVGQYAKADASLSHPNTICENCNQLIVCILTYLIKNDGDIESALNLLKTLSNNLNGEVKEWITESQNLVLEDYRCDVNIGHVKHAFMLALYFLRNHDKYTYLDAIRKTIEKGGDTDTNACIVGYVMGAITGYKNLPQHQKTTVVNFDCSTHDPKQSLMGYKRPEAYKASNVFTFLDSFDS